MLFLKKNEHIGQKVQQTIIFNTLTPKRFCPDDAKNNNISMVLDAIQVKPVREYVDSLRET